MPERSISQKNKKALLHKRSKHQNRYNFDVLIEHYPELGEFVEPNKFGDLSVDFFDPAAVKALNTALLKRYYGIEFWDIPDGYLCPPIPGRAEYIHQVADLLLESTYNAKAKVPRGAEVRCLDIGVGANCIYPLVGQAEYGWSFVGTDTDDIAIDSAIKIVSKNKRAQGSIEIRKQKNDQQILKGVIKEAEQFDLCICNPPFHASKEEALLGTKRKLKNLKGSSADEVVLNFGGQSNELWCEGGELAFIESMIVESSQFAMDVLWYSTLVSKEANVDSVLTKLKQTSIADVKVIPLLLGNKKSRIIAWTYLNRSQQKAWAAYRWS